MVMRYVSLPEVSKGMREGGLTSPLSKGKYNVNHFYRPEI